MKIERFITRDGLVRYRLRTPGVHSNYDGESTELSPAHLKAIYEYVLLHLHELEVERYNEEVDERNHLLMENREKPWLPPSADGEL